MPRPTLLLFVAALASGAPPAVAAEPPAVSIAAASNLIYALDTINAAFRRAAPGIAVTTASGASGSVFAQITHGAPFDVFLSADLDYPRQIVAQHLGPAATLRTFASGRLVVWTMRTDLDLGDLAAVVRRPAVRKIAIAQPQTAPYGRAAEAVLVKVGAWPEAQAKIVIGENITQTAQFIATGNADVGFVALSLVRSPRLRQEGTWREVPAALHAGVPLDHGVVLTHRGAANPSARRYLDFLSSETARAILRDYGYGVP